MTPPDSHIQPRDDGGGTPAVQNKSEVEKRKQGTTIHRIGGGNVPELFVRRRRKLRHTLIAMAIFVLLPTLIAGVYFGFVASERYVSEARLIIHDEQQNGKIELNILNMLGGSAGGGGDYKEIVYEYIRSAEMLNHLNKTLKLKALFSRDDIDWFSRLDPSAKQEKFIEYYRDHVEVVASTDSDVVKLRVEAYGREDPTRILQAIIDQSEVALNRVFDKRRNDVLRFAEDELGRAESRLAASRRILNLFRSVNGDIDPQTSAQAIDRIASQLMSKLATERAALHEMRSYLKPNSAGIRMQLQKIESLQQEIERERNRLAGSGKQGDYSDIIGQYQDLMIEEKFAEATYTSALAFYESSRSDALLKHSYVFDFVTPSHPDEATEPKRVRAILTTFIIALVALAIGSLILTAFREHARM